MSSLSLPMTLGSPRRPRCCCRRRVEFLDLLVVVTDHAGLFDVLVVVADDAGSPRSSSLLLPATVESSTSSLSLPTHAELFDVLVVVADDARILDVLVAVAGDG